MNPDLRYHLDKLSPEYRALLELMIMQNQSDKKEQSDLQRDILVRFDKHEAYHESLDKRMSELERAKLVFTTALWVIGGMCSLLFATSFPRILQFFLSI